MSTVIALTNQKGGVAKTTSVLNLGMQLSNKGKKVLLIDFDSQASLTISTGLEPYDYGNTIVTALQTNQPIIHDCIQILTDQLHIVTSRIELAQIEMELISRPVREKALDRILKPIKNDYDYILIDCPPQLSILTINALSCTDYVVIPVKTDYLAYRGLEQLLDSITEVRELIQPELKIMGVVATMYDSRTNDDKEILKALQDQYNVIGIVKQLVVAKKAIYDGVSNKNLPKNQISVEYEKIVNYIIEKVEL